MLTTLRANAWKYTAIALGLGLGFLLLMQTLSLAEARLDAAQSEATLHAERASASRAALRVSERYRTLEGNHREQLAKIGADASAAIAVAAADAGRARNAHDGMQRDLAAYILAHRRAAEARAAAGQCTPDAAALDLLADLQRRADKRAGELAEIADKARARGAGCEQSYDAAEAMSRAADAAAAQ